LTEKLTTELKGRLKRLILIPSDGGRFEVSVNGQLVFSKLKTGRFPDYQEIKKHL